MFSPSPTWLWFRVSHKATVEMSVGVADSTKGLWTVSYPPLWGSRTKANLSGGSGEKAPSSSSLSTEYPHSSVTSFFWSDG